MKKNIYNNKIHFSFCKKDFYKILNKYNYLESNVKQKFNVSILSFSKFLSGRTGI
jgi:hypothetical protein